MNNPGFFGGIFDFDGDGELDAFERAADFAAFMDMRKEEDDEDDGFSFDDNDEDSDDDEDF